MAFAMPRLNLLFTVRLPKSGQQGCCCRARPPTQAARPWRRLLYSTWPWLPRWLAAASSPSTSTSTDHGHIPTVYFASFADSLRYERYERLSPTLAIASKHRKCNSFPESPTLPRNRLRAFLSFLFGFLGPGVRRPRPIGLGWRGLSPFPFLLGSPFQNWDQKTQYCFHLVFSFQAT